MRFIYRLLLILSCSFFIPEGLRAQYDSLHIAMPLNTDTITIKSETQDNQKVENSATVKDNKKETEADKGLKHYFDAGMNLGGQLANDIFLLKSGVMANYAAYIPVNNRVLYGLGIGYEKYKEETFLPVTLNFIGKRDKSSDNTFFLSTRIGYAHGFNDQVKAFTNYSYRGGFVFSPGLGYSIGLPGDAAIMISTAYKQQFSQVRYKTADGITYKENLTWGLLEFKIGILL